MTSSHLEFYYDEDYKRLFTSIARDSVIAINKRQLDRTDVYKFSIFITITIRITIQYHHRQTQLYQMTLKN